MDVVEKLHVESKVDIVCRGYMIGRDERGATLIGGSRDRRD